MDRIILHCDLNSFYASVELRDRPDLRDVPVAVCGDPSSRHGIILAKNEPAKKYGVQTAETIWQAKKKCPGLVLLPPHHDLYRQISKQVNAIYDQYTDLVEPFGIDESWLDITHTLHLLGGDARAVADRLRERIKREMGLTLSVGATTKSPTPPPSSPGRTGGTSSGRCRWGRCCMWAARRRSCSPSSASAPSGSWPPAKKRPWRP